MHFYSSSTQFFAILTFPKCSNFTYRHFFPPLLRAYIAATEKSSVVMECDIDTLEKAFHGLLEHVMAESGDGASV